VRLSNRFTPLVDNEQLKEEFEEFQLMDELPGTDSRLDQHWMEILKMKTPMGERTFPTLSVVMEAVLCLPHSNADCERVFSQVRKIHTDCRKNLQSETLTALLQCKINTDSCCEISPTASQLELAKGATKQYNEDHK